MSRVSAAEFENNLHQSFAVTPGSRLVVDADRGSIEVATSETDKVEVQVFRKVRSFSQSRADDVFTNHDVRFDQRAEVVTVSAEYRGGLGGFFNRGASGLQVRYLIAIPKKFNVDLKTSGGTITQADLTGSVRVQTSGGNLKLAKIDGPVWGKTSGGSITLASSSGEVDVRTSGGGIQIDEAGGKVAARTSGGSIHVKLAKGDLLAKTSGGNIDLGQIEGSAVAKTSGGNIKVGELSGKLDAKTSGGSISAALVAQPGGDCHLETAGGSIHLRAVEKLAVDLDAKTSGGSVSSELPVAFVGKRKPSELRGQINGGGQVLCLRTSGGNIQLIKN